MSLPRPIIPNTTYLITRRCTQRQFLLSPTPEVTQIFSYCLAWATERTGVLVHAACVMSNHWHAVVTDLHGNLPVFLEHMHGFVSRSLNTHYKRRENLWSSEQASIVQLVDEIDIMDKLLYVWANPVAASLVPYSTQWPGLCSSPSDWMCKPRTIKRPEVFFRKHGTAPKTVELKFSLPRIFAGQPENTLVKELLEALNDREETIRRERILHGKTFLGKRAVLRQKITDTPQTPEERKVFSPQIAAKNKWQRLEALQRLKDFVSEYRKAYTLWKQGVRDVVFPEGTYALKQFSGAVCASSP